MVLRDHILDLVRRDGPMPFERFMEIALYHPQGGFFSSQVLRSQKAGDFLTSPEVSDFFGETLARYVSEVRARIGEPFALVEVAGGSGSLLRSLLAVAPPLEPWAVEVSPAARTALAEVVGLDRVVGELVEVPGPLRGVVLANELLDNLPMAVAQRTGGSWRERWVGEDDGGLVLVDTDVRPELETWLSAFAGDVDEGGWVEVQLAAHRWVAEAVDTLEAGAIVLIDYGDTAENLIPRRRDGTLRTYRGHHLGPHPLDEPGATDITADVNITAVVSAAESAGAAVTVWRQDDFLGAYGLRDQISALRHRELELARSGDDMERLAVRTRRTEAETLVHPRGLGDFRVVVAEKIEGNPSARGVVPTTDTPRQGA